MCAVHGHPMHVCAGKALHAHFETHHPGRQRLPEFLQLCTRLLVQLWVSGRVLEPKVLQVLADGCSCRLKALLPVKLKAPGSH